MKFLPMPALGFSFWLMAGGVFAGQFNLGAQYQSWTTNFISPLQGHEFLVPMSLSIDSIQDVQLYAQGEFADAQYTDPINGTQNLSDFSDTVAGGEIGFKSFGFDSFVNLAFNLPTGNQAWEIETADANIPTEFVDSRYQGRGFGLSGIYGLALPDGPTQYGLGVGYLYSGALNPNFGAGLPSENLKLGDSIFLSANRATTFTSNQTQTISASAYIFLPSLQAGQNFIWMGPNLNLSYSWVDLTAFSFEAGVQYFLPAQMAFNGQWVAESHDSLGTRFYLNPAWAFGNFVLAGEVKVVLANGYDPSPSDTLYDGGGLLLGLDPSYKFTLDKLSAIKVSASYDNITANGAAADSQGNRVNVIYNYWTVGADYEITL
jgi:hypothetical protein